MKGPQGIIGLVSRASTRCGGHPLPRHVPYLGKSRDSSWHFHIYIFPAHFSSIKICKCASALKVAFLASLVAQMVKNLPVMKEILVWPLGQKDPLRRKWQPTPVLLPGESHGGRSLVGYSPWGRKESVTTERLHLKKIVLLREEIDIEISIISKSSINHIFTYNSV